MHVPVDAILYAEHLLEFIDVTSIGVNSMPGRQGFHSLTDHPPQSVGRTGTGNRAPGMIRLPVPGAMTRRRGRRIASSEPVGPGDHTGSGRLSTEWRVACPHPGHLMRRFGFPEAFQRTPPASQTEISCPQGQRIIHLCDSARMSLAHEAGINAVSTFWIRVNSTPSIREMQIRFSKQHTQPLPPARYFPGEPRSDYRQRQHVAGQDYGAAVNQTPSAGYLTNDLKAIEKISCVWLYPFSFGPKPASKTSASFSSTL